MPAILTNRFSTVNMLNFLDSLEAVDKKTDENLSSLYLVLGKSTVWSDASDTVVPDPVSREADLKAFRDNAIVLVKVNPIQDIVPVVPMNKWAANKTYDVLSTTDTTSTALNAIRNTNWYCLAQNEANGINNVYQCVKGGTTSTGFMPSNIPNKNTIVTTGDTLQWKFLYNLETSIVTNGFLMIDKSGDGWLPVPYYYNAEVSTTSSTSSGVNGYVTSTHITNGDLLAPITLGCNHLMVRCQITDSIGLLDSSYYNMTYRQVALIHEPRAKSTNGLPGAILHGSQYKWSDIDITSGNIIYLENRKPVTRERNQTETIRLVVGF